MTKVYYFCFNGDVNSNRYIEFPSAQPKIDYICEKLLEQKNEVVLISACASKKGFVSKKEFHKDGFRSVYLTSYGSENYSIKKLSIITIWIQLIFYLIFIIKKEDKILFYHSMFFYFPMKISKFFRREINFIMQVEELYSQLSIENKKFECQEISLIRMAKSHIFVNDLINEKVKSDCFIISYGPYKVTLPNQSGSIKTDKIKLVYSGVIEDVRKAAFYAIESMLFLNQDYELYVLGFGNEDDINKLKCRITDINSAFGEERVFYYGKIVGEKFDNFLTSCDIGISSHIYSLEEKPSADYTFPSKILKYLSCNLRVVSNDIDSVVKSSISDLLYFFSGQTPKCIASTISFISIDSNYDSVYIIREMDKKFGKELNKLIIGN